MSIKNHGVGAATYPTAFSVLLTAIAFSMAVLTIQQMVNVVTNFNAFCGLSTRGSLRLVSVNGKLDIAEYVRAEPLKRIHWVS